MNVDAAAPPLLSVRDLHTHFPQEEGTVKAVDGVSFDLYPGRTLGIVGESGCGKSMTARSILRILDRPGRIVAGEILLPAPAQLRASSANSTVVDLAQLDANSDEMRAIRGAEIALVFQEPMSSFSPVHTIGNQIVEAILLHQKSKPTGGTGTSRRRVPSRWYSPPRAASRRLLTPAERRPAPAGHDRHGPGVQPQPADRRRADNGARCHHPGANSGPPAPPAGQEYGMAIMLITHDLGVIAEIADDVVVMYLGRVVEHAPVDELFHAPRHPLHTGPAALDSSSAVALA